MAGMLSFDRGRGLKPLLVWLSDAYNGGATHRSGNGRVDLTHGDLDERLILQPHFVILRSGATKNLVWRLRNPLIVGDSSLPLVAQNDNKSEMRL